jgi:hypothetical protein
MIRMIYRMLSLYWNARAISRGRYPQRVARRNVYRVAGRVARRIFKP